MSNRKFFLCCILCLTMTLCLSTALAAQEGPQPEGRPQGEALSLREWTPEELDALQQGLAERAATWQGHSLPTAEQIQLPQALALAEQALQQQLGLTSDEVTTFTVMPFFVTVDGWVNVEGARVDLPAPYWQMTYGDGACTVYLDAGNGSLLTTPVPGDGNG